jgi:hypothetical protein
VRRLVDAFKRASLLARQGAFPGPEASSRTPYRSSVETFISELLSTTLERPEIFFSSDKRSRRGSLWCSAAVEIRYGAHHSHLVVSLELRIQGKRKNLTAGRFRLGKGTRLVAQVSERRLQVQG